MKRFNIITFILILGSLTAIKACPVGWQYSDTTYPRSVGYSFVESYGGYILTGAVSDESRVQNKLLFMKMEPFSSNYSLPSKPLWTKVFDDIKGQGRCIKETPDKCLITAGYIPKHDNARPMVMLVKTDSAANLIWKNSFHVEGKAYSVALNDDGGYLVVGNTDDGEEASFDLLLIKYNASGNFLWNKAYGNEAFDEARCITKTSDGNYVIVGSKDMDPHGNNGKLWWIKVDPNGNKLWEKTLTSIENPSRGFSIAKTTDSGFVISGCSIHTDSTTHLSNYALLLLKISKQGEIQWTQDFTPPDIQTPKEFTSWAEQTNDGGYIVTWNEKRFLKTDSLGNAKWGSDVLPETQYYCVHQTARGGYAALGRKANKLYMMDADNMGRIYIGGTNEASYSDNTLIVSNPIGNSITLNYSNLPNGLHAFIYNVSGSKVDELHSSTPSGSITWGNSFETGIYFIKDITTLETKKVVLLK